MSTSFTVRGLELSPGRPPLIVAEMSGNHNGDLGRALAIVDAVAEAGAQALKLQTYRADTITIDADGPAFRIGSDHQLWAGQNLYQLYDRAHTPWEWHAPIFERALQHGLIPFSSPFDPSAIELLEDLECSIYKVASAEIVDLPLIRAMAATGKPLIISTGMATLGEIDDAVRAACSTGSGDVALLACTSSYPATPSAARLRSIPVLRDAFALPIGLSDHTTGIGVAIAAVALGASIIEKHVTLDRSDGGVDSAFSLDPTELASLCREAGAAAEAVTAPHFGPLESEAHVHRLRRSLWVVADVERGETVTDSNVRSIRPGGGLPPAVMPTVLGRTFTSDVAAGTPLSWDLV